jgi:hypothetical protein
MPGYAWDRKRLWHSEIKPTLLAECTYSKRALFLFGDTATQRHRGHAACTLAGVDGF